VLKRITQTESGIQIPRSRRTVLHVPTSPTRLTARRPAGRM